MPAEHPGYSRSSARARNEKEKATPVCCYLAFDLALSFGLGEQLACNKNNVFCGYHGHKDLQKLS